MVADLPPAADLGGARRLAAAWREALLPAQLAKRSAPAFRAAISA